MRREVPFRSERGIALPMALGMMMVISIVLVAVLAFSGSTERHSELSKANQIAVAVAEAGLNQAESVVANASSPTALPTSCASSPTVTAEGGTACYWGSFDSTTSVLTVSAVSSVPNPTGGAAVSHTVTAQFDVQASTMPDNDVWNYVFSNAPGLHVLPEQRPGQRPDLHQGRPMPEEQRNRHRREGGRLRRDPARGCR
jgi:Tfp pilus assembly protein PilX